MFLAQSHIEDLSLLISSKLHFLSDCESNEKLSSVQVMTVKIDVSFSCIEFVNWLYIIDCKISCLLEYQF